MLIAVIFAAGCSRNEKQNDASGTMAETVIEGVISGGDHQLVTLDRMGATAFEPIDSVRCDRKGAFRIGFESTSFDYYALKYTEQGYVTLALFPGDKVTINGNDSSAFPYSVKGSEASALIRELAAEHKQVLDSLEQISLTSREIIGSPGHVQKKEALNRKFDSITHAFNTYSREFIRKNTGSPAILIALYNLYGPGLPVFDPRTDLDIYRYTDSALFSRYSENEAVRALNSQLQTVLQQMRHQQAQNELEPGMEAPDFVSTDPEGNRLALSELRGSYILVQFWASWSKPSVDENTFLRNCRDLFAEKELKILQVSLDDQREKWLSAIEQGNLDWYHVSDLRRWDSPVANLYRVDRIPSNFLVDPDGIIVEKDIFGDDLEASLNKYL